MYKKLVCILVSMVVLAGCAGPEFDYRPEERMPMPRDIGKVNVALALGGGGSKGYAHIGVLEVLEKNGIPIDLITGTSAGSIIGSMYANYADYKIVEDLFIDVETWDILDVSLADSFKFFIDLKGPIKGDELENFIEANSTVRYAENLQIPFIAVATELNTENPVYFSSGPLSKIVHASAALPPFFTPVEMYGRLFADGGIVEPVPVEAAKLYNPKIVIAVDITGCGSKYPLNSMWQVTNKSLAIAYYNLSQHQSRKADVLIHPELSNFGLFDEGRKQDLYNIGKEAALKALPQIKELMRRHGIKFIRNKLE